MSAPSPEEPGFEHDVNELTEDQDINPETLEDDPLPEDKPDASDDGNLIQAQDDAAQQRKEGGYQ